MIVVVGSIADSVTELVCARLNDCGYRYRLFDLGQFPAQHQVDIRWRHGLPDGTISGLDWRVGLSEIQGIFVRFPGPEARTLNPRLAESQARQLQVEADMALLLALDNLRCLVVNRLGGGMSNNSKPYQAIQIARSGLRVPATLVSNDEEAVRDFAAEHGELVYKSISGIRSVVRRLGRDHLDRLRLLQFGPSQFQAFVPGENVRVHTVGDEIFATRIHSDAVDYRYARLEGHQIAMEPAELPLQVAEACLAVTRSLGLCHAGIDLKQTPDGEWYCFEVNPCPGFIYFERQTGQPISLALADFLHAGRTDFLELRDAHPAAFSYGPRTASLQLPDGGHHG